MTNLLASNALVRAFIEQQKPVSAEIIESITRDCSLDEVELLAQPAPVPRTRSKAHVASAPENHARGEPPRLRAKTVPSGRTASRHFGIAQMKLPLFVYGYGPEGDAIL